MDDTNFVGPKAPAVEALNTYNQMIEGYLANRLARDPNYEPGTATNYLSAHAYIGRMVHELLTGEKNVTPDDIRALVTLMGGQNSRDKKGKLGSQDIKRAVHGLGGVPLETKREKKTGLLSRLDPEIDEDATEEIVPFDPNELDDTHEENLDQPDNLEELKIGAAIMEAHHLGQEKLLHADPSSEAVRQAKREVWRILVDTYRTAKGMDRSMIVEAIAINDPEARDFVGMFYDQRESEAVAAKLRAKRAPV